MLLTNKTGEIRGGMLMKGFLKSIQSLQIVVITIALGLTLVTGTYAWYTSANKVNEFVGNTANDYSVKLVKREKDVFAKETDKAIEGARFLLFTDSNKQIGAVYTTDANGEINISNLGRGNYYFKEIATTADYEFDSDANGSIDMYHFTIDKNTSHDEALIVYAYNQRKAANLTLSKEVVVAEGITPKANLADMTFAFTIEFYENDQQVIEPFIYNINGKTYTYSNDSVIYLKDHEHVTFENLPVGMLYHIKELPMDGFIYTSENTHMYIKVDGNQAKVINKYIGTDVEKATLKVSKSVVAEAVDINQAFAFDVKFLDGKQYKYTLYNQDNTIAQELQELAVNQKLVLKHGQYAIFIDIPVDVLYEIHEEELVNYQSLPSRAIDSIHIHGNEEHFMNTELDKDRGRLAIHKEVLYGEHDDAFEFSVTFKNATPQSIFTYLLNDQEYTFKSGQTITLKNGEVAYFIDLPAGLEYEVIEKEYAQYTTSYDNNIGVIQAKEEAKVHYTNVYESIPVAKAKLTIRKEVVSNVAIDANKVFTFFVTINGIRSSIDLKANETVELVVPIGSTYTVSEKDYAPDGYELISITNNSGIMYQDVEVKAINKIDVKEKITITGDKTWELQNESVTLPESIEIHLLANQIRVETKTVKPNPEGKWEFTFVVDKFDGQGNEISYTIQEVAVDGFKTAITRENYVFHIKNIYVVPVTVVPFELEKVIQGDTPSKTSEFVFKLTGLDGAPMPSGALNNEKVISIMGSGKAQFDAITFRKPGTYVYTVTEMNSGFAGYTYDRNVFEWTVEIGEQGKLVVNKTSLKNKMSGETVNKALFINKYKDDVYVEKVRIDGQKTWDHGKNSLDKYPKSIIIYVKKGNEIIIQREITASDSWKYSFSVDRYDSNGNEIQYTVDEATVSGYEKRISGYNVKNVHETSPDYKGDKRKPNIDPNGGGNNGGADTSDSTTLLVWFGMLMTSYLVVILVLIDKRRKRKRRSYKYS